MYFDSEVCSLTAQWHARREVWLRGVMPSEYFFDVSIDVKT